MTPNQQRAVRLRPHLQEVILAPYPLPNQRRASTEVQPRKIRLPTCSHRGKILDKTTCKCVVFACEVHGTCSSNAKAGLTTCPCEAYQAPQGHN